MQVRGWLCVVPGGWLRVIGKIACVTRTRGANFTPRKKRRAKRRKVRIKKKKEKEKKKKGNIIEAWSVVCVREKKGAHEYFIVLVNSRDAKHVLYQIVLHMYSTYNVTSFYQN